MFAGAAAGLKVFTLRGDLCRTASGQQTRGPPADAKIRFCRGLFLPPRRINAGNGRSVEATCADQCPINAMLVEASSKEALRYHTRRLKAIWRSVSRADGTLHEIAALGRKMARKRVPQDGIRHCWRSVMPFLPSSRCCDCCQPPDVAVCLSRTDRAVVPATA